MFIAGADPELFLIEGNKFKSAIGIIPGTKEEPFATEHGAIHCDNVAAEFNTLPAATCADFIRNTKNSLDLLTDIVEKAGYSVSQKSSAIFDKSELCTPEAIEAGCSSDINAYTGTLNSGVDLLETRLRCVGGHVHIGKPPLKKSEVASAIKVLDLFVSVPMLQHEDEHRRQLYGKAGAYRIKRYGFEYRTPSNFWIFSEKRMAWLYSQVSRALDCFRDVTIPDNLREIIDNHQVDKAGSLFEPYNLIGVPK